MHKQTKDLYKLPDIEKYQDIDLLTLSETCAILEEKVLEIAASLPQKKRYVIEDYIRTGNDLEFETFKTALRWGKKNYK